MPLAIRGHDTLSASDGDVYFFLAQANPVHGGSLIALFPLAQHHRGCIGMALSRDGMVWSRVTPLLRCAVHGSRTEHQPVGFTPLADGSIALLVHEYVPGIAFDMKTPYQLASILKRAGKRRSNAQLARYTFPCALLVRWTQQQLAELGEPRVRKQDFVCPTMRGGHALACRAGAT